MSNKRRKARYRRSRAAATASNPVAKPDTPAGNLPALPPGWSRWHRNTRVDLVRAYAAATEWVPDFTNRHLKDAARGLESIGYPLCPPAPIQFPPPSFCVTLPRKHGRSGVRC